jgi:ATP-binding cassette subfamily C (CFTR/MRP) protein 1
MFTVFATFVATLTLYIATLQAARIIHNSLLKRVLKAPMEFFDQTPTGRLINRFSKDTEGVDSDIPSTARALLSCLFSVNNRIEFGVGLNYRK